MTLQFPEDPQIDTLLKMDESNYTIPTGFDQRGASKY
jgi:hypothetical protein